MQEALDELTRQFLLWLSEKPRTYAEVMDAWRTSCPRLSVWENAISDGLAHVTRDGEGTAVVRLTPQGQQVLAIAKVPT